MNAFKISDFNDIISDGFIFSVGSQYLIIDLGIVRFIEMHSRMEG